MHKSKTKRCLNQASLSGFIFRRGLTGSLVSTLVILFWGWLSNSLLSAQQEELAAKEFSAEQVEFFESKIRPLLVQHCFECHSQQSSHAEGGLFLDSRQGILVGGDSGPAIDAEDFSASIFLDAINYGELFEMPPSSKLPQAEIDLLTRWIEMGAPWPTSDNLSQVIQKKFDIEKLKSEHWCWHPPQSAPIPEVQDPAWNQQAIDRFIYHQLTQNQLTPSPPADRQTLIRRAYFDLIGLPPTPQQVQNFMDSAADDAFEQVVDQLLDSPQFGERWARHWMDLVRYAETYGHEFDFPIKHAFQYRDYLIRAFNADLPYDQFVLEHLAGDLLATPRRHWQHGYNESILGTGFWFLGEAVHAPVDVRADQAGRIDNQIDVFTKTFLGLTVACARCHDHKFDAISIDDYYGLVGYLQSSRRHDVMLDPDGTIAETVGKLTQAAAQADRQVEKLIADFRQLPAEIFSRPLAASWHTASSNGEIVHENLAVPTDILSKWNRGLQDAEVAELSHPLYPISQLTKLLTSRPEFEFSEIAKIFGQQLADIRSTASRNQATSKLFADFSSDSYGEWFAEGHAFAQTERATLAIAETRLLQPANLAYSGRLGGQTYGVLRSPTFEIQSPYIHYRLLAKDIQIRLIIDGFEMDIFNPLLFEGMSFKINTDGQYRWHTQAGDLGKYLGHRAYIEVVDHGAGFAALDQIWFSQEATPPQWISPLFSTLLAQLTPDNSHTAESLAAEIAEILLSNRAELLDDQIQFINWLVKYELLPAELSAAAASLNQQKQELNALQNGLPAPILAPGIADGNGVDEKLFVRGNHRNLGAEVPRGMISALRSSQQPDTEAATGSGRLELARQIASPDNPLTARVIVNRVWQHLMGRGIVTSVDNFGVLGEPPTHPELLDFLALDFVAHDWSLKRIIKQIMLSQTYQMSSKSVANNEIVDPANRWYHRAPVRRLDGEAIRDSMLAISGDLNLQLYGPSVPVHLTSFMQGRGRPGKSGPLNGAGRRSIYQEVRRNFLSPFLLAFDTPIPFNTIGRRTESNVPAQALILMNSPFVRDQATKWAQQSIAQHPELVPRIEAVYLSAFARPPSPFEIEQALQFLQTQAEAANLSPDLVPLHLELWADYCHVLFNVKEFIFLR